MKCVFFGSDDFAAVHLDALISSSHEVLACVTQPDRAKGRGMKVVLSPVKVCAQKHHIPVLQPEELRVDDFMEALKALDADFFVVIAYGRILPAEVLSIPKQYALNVHGSLLPQYRGAAPINWAIINGDMETGLSIIKMNAKMDAGDILAQKKIGIFPEDTSATLRAKMMQEGPIFLLKTLNNMSLQALSRQNERQVSLAPKLTKELGCIDWHKSAHTIHNLIRGLLPWPSAYTFYQNKPLKILASEVQKRKDVTDVIQNIKPGDVIEINKQGFFVMAGSDSGDAVLVKEVQWVGGRRMDAASFVRGHQIELGFSFVPKSP